MGDKSRTVLLASLVAVSVGLAACGSDKASSKASGAATASATSIAASGGAVRVAAGNPSAVPEQAAAGAATTAGGVSSTTVAPSGVSGGNGAGDVLARPNDGTKLIVTVTMDVEVTDVGSSSIKAATLAEGVGGQLFSQQTNLGGERPTSTIVFKVPPGKVGSLLESLRGIGKVLTETKQAEDVTAQYVDVESRITAARDSVARVRSFLDKTQDVAQLAGMESELTRRQSELEQLLGQQRVLDAHTALATVTLTLVPAPKAADVVKPKTSKKPTIGGALRSGGTALVQVATAIAIVGAFLQPWLPVIAAFALAVWFVRRRSFANRPGSSPQPPTAGSGYPPMTPVTPASPQPTPPPIPDVEADATERDRVESSAPR